MPTTTTNSVNRDSAFDQAIRHGWMSANQYVFLAEELRSTQNASLLVFGAGYDSLLWAECAAGGVAFVEDNPTYLTLPPAGAVVVAYEYSSQVGEWSCVPVVPRQIDRPWDFVLVDGPAGFAPHCPGRQFPIEWARWLARRRIFVHDYERPWECAVCDETLGRPQQVIKPDVPGRGELAVFDRQRVKQSPPADSV